MTATIKHISLGLFTFVIALVTMQPETGSQHTGLSINQNNCITKTLLLDQKANNFQQILQYRSNPDQKRSDTAMTGSCQSMSSFVVATNGLILPAPAITGRTYDSSISQYAFLIDDRTSDPPKYYS